VLLLLQAAGASVAQDTDAANIESIMKKMTLKQKIGQMLLVRREK
jgi:hypothetical protein